MTSLLFMDRFFFIVVIFFLSVGSLGACGGNVTVQATPEVVINAENGDLDTPDENYAIEEGMQFLKSSEFEGASSEDEICALCSESETEQGLP